MNPRLLVQIGKRADVESFRHGLQECGGVIALGIDASLFWSIAGLDALFLTLPAAEAWGSRPGTPHTCEVLKTPEIELKKGFPPYVITGVILREEDSKAGQFVLPLVVRSMISAVLDFNVRGNEAISVVGFTGIERFAAGLSYSEMGELIGLGYADGSRLHR